MNLTCCSRSSAAATPAVGTQSWGLRSPRAIVDHRGAALGLLLLPFMKATIGLSPPLVIIAVGCLIAGAVTFGLRHVAEPPEVPVVIAPS